MVIQRLNKTKKNIAIMCLDIVPMVSVFDYIRSWNKHKVNSE